MTAQRHVEQPERNAIKPANDSGPSPAWHEGYDRAHVVQPHAKVASLADHGFPSHDEAMRALGLTPEGSAQSAQRRGHDRYAAADIAQGPHDRYAAADTKRRPHDVRPVERHQVGDPGQDKVNSRNSEPFKSDTVSDSQFKDWKDKFNDLTKQPDVSRSSLMHDMDKLAREAGTNPDGSPKVFIGRARDQMGITHYYAEFNSNQKQFEANEHAVREGKVNFQATDGTKAAIAEIGIYKGGTTV